MNMLPNNENTSKQTLGPPAITEPEYHSFPWNGPLPNEKIVGDTVFIPTDGSLDKVDSNG